MKFPSPEVGLYFYKSAIRPCIKYCWHEWASVPHCYLDKLDKLQKHVFRNVLLTRVSLEPLGHCKNVGSLSFSIDITLVDVHLNCLNRLCFLILMGGPLFILIDSMIFLSPFLDVIKMSIVSFLTQLDPAILCLQNAWPMI